MSELKDTEALSILVLGSAKVKISYFIKLFSAYLRYETFSEVMSCESHMKFKVKNVKETTMHEIVEIQKNKLQFINTPGLQKSTKLYGEIIEILLRFKSASILHAIIFLIEPDSIDDANYFEQYSTHFFSGLRSHAKNILYIYLYNNSCMYYRTYKNLQKAMDSVKISAIVPQNKNVFHLNVETFYELSESNWEESVSFCKDVFKYITGGSLKSFYVQCEKPTEESFLNLIGGLTILLCQAYYLTEFYRLYKRLYCVNYFQKNVTVCYNKDCIGRTEKINVATQASFTICHENCNCTQSVLDVKACSVFRALGNKCSACNCAPSFHQRYFYKFDAIVPILDIINNEKIVIKSALLQCFLFLIRNKSITITDFITTVFSWSNDEKRGILDDIKADLEEIITMQNEEVTREMLLVSLFKLHEIQIVTTVLPDYIREYFPDGFHLGIVAKPLKETKVRSYKAEYYSIKKEYDELKVLFDEILNPSSSNCFKKHPEGQRQGEIKKSGSYKMDYYNIKVELDKLKVQFDEMLNRISNDKLSNDSFNKQYFKQLNIEETDGYASDSSSNKEGLIRKVHYGTTNYDDYTSNSNEEPFYSSDNEQTTESSFTDI